MGMMGAVETRTAKGVKVHMRMKAGWRERGTHAPTWVVVSSEK
jgi:hypothetical protein